MIRKIIPVQLKLKLHLFRGLLRDLIKGYYFKYAKSEEPTHHYSKHIQIKQELKPNDAKSHNLSKAINSINLVRIEPDQIFSFWKIVGNPTKKNGFVESRSIVNGNIEKSYGGGLCQLSGLIYYVSLYAGLEILERHNHSIDIYTDETRFTPLGSDATIAYAYKDLKIRNNLSKPIQFIFSLEEEYITIELLHSDLIEKNTVEFEEKVINDTAIEVVTLLNGQVLDTSSYRRENSPH